MKDVDSIESILDFAISEEEAANRFYKDLARQMEEDRMKEVFEDFAAEELGHKAKLQDIRENPQAIQFDEERIPDLGIADYAVVRAPDAKMNYQDALLLAMKKEKASYRLYIDLASVAQSEDLTNTFLWLAQEEAKHKLRFEIEYDDFILGED